MSVNYTLLYIVVQYTTLKTHYIYIVIPLTAMIGIQLKSIVHF